MSRSSSASATRAEPVTCAPTLAPSRDGRRFAPPAAADQDDRGGPPWLGTPYLAALLRRCAKCHISALRRLPMPERYTPEDITASGARAVAEQRIVMPVWVIALLG